MDNTIRYADHFLRYPLGSDDRDAEYEAINRADPSKVPDSDPTKATYKPAVVDKPATDAMEKGGQYQRLLLALVILLGELGTVLLLGSLSVSVLLAQMVVLLLACFAPVALVAGIVPGRGHDLFKNWARHLTTYLARKAAYSLVLAVLLAALAALQGVASNLGWLLSFAMQSMFMWMVFLHRAKLAGTITSAVSGQHPERDTQLRRLLGVAYVARRSVNPARRRGGTSHPAPPAEGDEPSPPSDETPPPSGPPPTGPSPAPPDRSPALPGTGLVAMSPSGRGGAGASSTDDEPGVPPASGRTHGRPDDRRTHRDADRSSLPAPGRTHAPSTTSADHGQEQDDTAGPGADARAAKPAARRHPRSPQGDKTDHRHQRHTADAPPDDRREGSERPSARALETDAPPPEPPPTRPSAEGAPRSLADELRNDRARRQPIAESHGRPDDRGRRRPDAALRAESDDGAPEGSA